MGVEHDGAVGADVAAAVLDGADEVLHVALVAAPGVRAGDLSPAGNLGAGFDLDERLGADAEAAHGGDADGRGAVGGLFVGGEDVVGGEGGGGDGGGGGEEVAAVDGVFLAHRGGTP